MTNKFKFGDKVSYRSCKNAFYLQETDDIRSLIAVEKFGAIKGAVITVITNELAPASDWVKCSERMPELYESVLVLYTDGSISDDWTIERKGQRTWNCISTEDATHWMPLPDLPTEDA